MLLWQGSSSKRHTWHCFMPKTSILMSSLVRSVALCYVYYTVPPILQNWPNLVIKKLILQLWIHFITRESLLKLRVAGEKILHVDGKVLLHVRFVTFCVRVWRSVDPDLTMDMIFSTPFIDQFIRGIFLSKRKILSWESHSIAILFTDQYQKPTTLQGSAYISAKKCTDHAKESLVSIRTARQVVLEPHTQRRVLVTTSASSIQNVKPEILENRSRWRPPRKALQTHFCFSYLSFCCLISPQKQCT